MINRSILNYWRSRQIDWDELWLTQAHLMAMRSRCSRDRIGAVIVDVNNVLVASGYNGAAPTDPVDKGGWCQDWCPRAKAHPRGEPAPVNGYVDCPSTHAEINALLRVAEPYVLSTIYVTALPCYSCAKFIAACRMTKGLQRVVIPEDGMPGYRDPDKVVAYLENCGITVTKCRTP